MKTTLIITILLLSICTALTGCYGNLRHGNRMYDSSQVYFDSANLYFEKAWNERDLKKADAYYKQRDRCVQSAEMYADSMDYYLSRRFERER